MIATDTGDRVQRHTVSFSVTLAGLLLHKIVQYSQLNRFCSLYSEPTIMDV